MCSFLGSGTSLILELFLELSKYNTKNRIRFAWWGAEENGLLGSRHYCSNLNVDDVNDLLVYLNFDMVSKGFFGVADTDGSEHGSVAPPGSEVTERIFREYFKDQGLEVTPATLTNGSDYAPFWQILNKPFGFLHTGKNTPYLSRWPFLFSVLTLLGTAVEQDPCYHQACDTIDNPDAETITINAKVSAIMRNIHMSKITNFASCRLLPIFLLSSITMGRP